MLFGKNTFSFVFALAVAFTASCVTAGAQDVTMRQRIESLVSDPVLSQAQVGVCVRKMSGEVVADVNGERMLVPASNMKLITTGAALHELGGDFRFGTAIAYSGEIVGGVLNGDVYIIGGADPTLGSRDSIATAIDVVFHRWKGMLDDAGIRKINGHIVGDGRWFGDMPEEESWLWSDLGTYYGCGTTGLMFYENMQSFMVSPGAQAGDRLKIEMYYPSAPWMKYSYDCCTGEAKTGDRLYMYTSEFAPAGVLRGTFAVDRKRKRVDCSNKFPEYTCAKYFSDYLNGAGLVNSGAGDFRLSAVSDFYAPGCNEKTVGLGKTFSPALRRIVFETNHQSNNLYAETMMRTLGKKLKGSDSYEASVKAVKEILSGLMGGEQALQGIHIKDGSGLSRQNYVSADFFCRFLIAMTKSPVFEDFAASLPSPGSNGSLQYNMQKYSRDLKERVYLKSGSMNGVLCYSGYVVPEGCCIGDALVFSVMVNNCTAPSWKLRPLLDSIIAVIAE